MYMGLVVPMWAERTLRDPVAVVSATEISIGFNSKRLYMYHRSTVMSGSSDFTKITDRFVESVSHSF